MHPVPGAWISARYRQAGRHWSLGWHTGIDYAAPVGTPIRSATHGTVIAANAYDATYGNKVIVRSAVGDVWYCHMSRGAARVKVGDRVEAGQQIGSVGDTGNVTGAHLHLEVRRPGAGFAAGSFIDPAKAVDFTPRPYRIESVNLGDDNERGRATRKKRRARLLTDILRPGAVVVLFQEAPKAGVYAWLTANVSKRPRGRRQGHRETAGASGRRIWSSKRVTVSAKGVLVPEQRGISKGKPGAPKPLVWQDCLIDEYRRRLIVNVHGPFGINPAAKRRYWREAFQLIDGLRKSRGLAWRQVVIAGDTNAPKIVRRRAKKYGLRDVRLMARATRGAKWSTLNGWKPRRRIGGRPDLILAHEDATVIEYRNPKDRGTRDGTQALTDHNRQIAILR